MSPPLFALFALPKFGCKRPALTTTFPVYVLAPVTVTARVAILGHAAGSVNDVGESNRRAYVVAAIKDQGAVVGNAGGTEAAGCPTVDRGIAQLQTARVNGGDARVRIRRRLMS